MRGMTKKRLIILYVFDIITILILAHFFIWWKQTRALPGLAEKLSIGPFVVYLILALALLVLLTKLLIAMIREEINKKK